MDEVADAADGSGGSDRRPIGRRFALFLRTFGPYPLIGKKPTPLNTAFLEWIPPCVPSRCHHRLSHVSKKLCRLFIHRHNGNVRIIRKSVNIQYRLHSCNEFSV